MERGAHVAGFATQVRYSSYLLTRDFVCSDCNGGSK